MGCGWLQRLPILRLLRFLRPSPFEVSAGLNGRFQVFGFEVEVVCMIAVVGSLNRDLVIRAERFPAPGETVLGSGFRTVPGGKGANQAVAMARLGARVGMVGAVGEDSFGAMMREGLVRDGIDS